MFGSVDPVALLRDRKGIHALVDKAMDLVEAGLRRNDTEGAEERARWARESREVDLQRTVSGLREALARREMELAGMRRDRTDRFYTPGYRRAVNLRDVAEARLLVAQANAAIEVLFAIVRARTPKPAGPFWQLLDRCADVGNNLTEYLHRTDGNATGITGVDRFADGGEQSEALWERYVRTAVERRHTVIDGPLAYVVFRPRVRSGELESGLVVASTEVAARRMMEAHRGLEPPGTWLGDDVHVLKVGPVGQDQRGPCILRFAQ